MPKCPKCAAIKVEDYGDTTYGLGYFQDAAMRPIANGVREHNKNSDRNLRAVAERYGLGDMNNKGGQAVKRAAPQNNSGPTVKVGGIEVPMSSAMGAGCVNIPGMAQKIPMGSAPRAPQKSAMMGGMTRVVGEHKAGA